MTIARRTAEALSTFRTAIRREVRDPATDRSGIARAAASLRWSNDEIDAAFNLALEDLQRDLSELHPGDRLIAVDTTYTAEASNIALPAGLTNASLIYKVENLTDPAYPLPVSYVSPLEIERFSSPQNLRLIKAAYYRFTIVASGTDVVLQVRPTPKTDLSIRISALAPPTITGSSSDAHPFTAQWYEYIALLAAKKLLRPDDEFSLQQQDDLSRLRSQVLATSTRAGPQRIRTTRRFKP